MVNFILSVGLSVAAESLIMTFLSTEPRVLTHVIELPTSTQVSSCSYKRVMATAPRVMAVGWHCGQKLTHQISYHLPETDVNNQSEHRGSRSREELFSAPVMQAT